MYLLVKEKTASKFAGLLGAGVFASAFMLTGQWFDIARTDMLAAALSMLGIYFGREQSNNSVIPTEQRARTVSSGLPARLFAARQLRVIYAALLSGLMFALAFMTKQSALIVGLAAILYYFVFN